MSRLVKRLMSRASSRGQRQHRGGGGLLGPGLFSYVFARSITPEAGWQLPGAPFLLAAAMLVLATALAWWTTRPGHASPAQ